MLVKRKMDAHRDNNHERAQDKHEADGGPSEKRRSEASLRGEVLVKAPRSPPTSSLPASSLAGLESGASALPRRSKLEPPDSPPHGEHPQRGCSDGTLRPSAETTPYIAPSSEVSARAPAPAPVPVAVPYSGPKLRLVKRKVEPKPGSEQPPALERVERPAPALERAERLPQALERVVVKQQQPDDDSERAARDSERSVVKNHPPDLDSDRSAVKRLHYDDDPERMGVKLDDDSERMPIKRPQHCASDSERADVKRFQAEDDDDEPDFTAIKREDGKISFADNDDQAVHEFRLDTSLGVFKVTNPSGLYVRLGKELNAAKSGHLCFGETFEAFQRATNSVGVARIRTQLGWTSEIGASGRRYVELVPDPPKDGACSLLDGMWRRRDCGKLAFISGYTLGGADDFRKTSDTTCKVMIGGKWYQGEASGDVLAWDDGDLWYRVLRAHPKGLLSRTSLTKPEKEPDAPRTRPRIAPGETETLFLCDLCDKKFVLLADLKAHQASGVHSAGPPPDTAAHVPPEDFQQCSLCEQRFRSLEDLETHKAQEHDVGVKWFSCVWCGERFRHLAALKEHRQEMHGVGTQWYECCHCKQSFPRTSMLKRHLAEVHQVYDEELVQQ